MKRPLFYGWVVVFACMLLHFCAAGMTCLGFSLHGAYLRDEIGISNTQVSLINTFLCLSTMLSLPFVETVYRRVSIRQGISAACLALSASYIGFAYSSQAFHFYICAIIMGFVYAFGTAIPITLLLRKWFIRRRATADAIALCGAGFCSMLAPPLITYSVEAFGLKQTFLLEAGCMSIIAGLLWLLVQNSPQEMGVAAYGERDVSAVRAGGGGIPISQKELRLLLAAVFLVGCIGAPCSTHLQIHFATVGYSSGWIAAAISVYGIALTIGKFSYGFFTDAFNAYRVNFAFFSCWVLAQLFTVFMTPSAVGTLMISNVLQGIGAAITTVGVPIWIDNFSTEEAYARNMEHSQLIYSVGALVMTPFPGIIADATGSYIGAFVIFGAMAAAAFYLVQCVYHRYHTRLKS